MLCTWHWNLCWISPALQARPFSHNMQMTGCLHTRAHHPPSPQKVVMGTTHKNLGLLGHKSQKRREKTEADFRFVVHQHHQIDHARNLPLHWETPTEFLENAEVHSLMPCNFKHPKVGAFFFLICRCQSDPIEKSISFMSIVKLKVNTKHHPQCSSHGVPHS